MRISEAVTIGSDHLRAHQTFNDVGAPVAVDGSDGSWASFEYSAPNRVNLTLTPLSGASFVVSYNPQTGEILSDERVSPPTTVRDYEQSRSVPVPMSKGMRLQSVGNAGSLSTRYR